MKKVFKGKVKLGDAYRCYNEDLDGAVFIGDDDVVGTITGAGFKGPVTVGIGEEFAGDLDADTGWGYSEYTPMDPDRLKVGTHDLLEILERYEGKEVTVWVADEPVNLLEPV